MALRRRVLARGTVILTRLLLMLQLVLLLVLVLVLVHGRVHARRRLGGLLRVGPPTRGGALGLLVLAGGSCTVP